VREGAEQDGIPLLEVPLHQGSQQRLEPRGRDLRVAAVGVEGPVESLRDVQQLVEDGRDALLRIGGAEELGTQRHAIKGLAALEYDRGLPIVPEGPDGGARAAPGLAGDEEDARCADVRELGQLAGHVVDDAPAEQGSVGTFGAPRANPGNGQRPRLHAERNLSIRNGRSSGHGGGGTGMLSQHMGEAKRYWVRNEQGRVWGPFPAEQLVRLKGQITDRSEVSLDGRVFRPVAEFPEVQPFVVHRPEPRRAEPAAAAERPAEANAPYIGPGLRAMFSMPGQAAHPAAAPPAAASAPAAAPPAASARRAPPLLNRNAAPGAFDAMTLPASGDLAAISPIRLYALAALNASNGALEISREDGRRVTVNFRRGTPAHLSTDDPDLSLVGFLQAKKVIAPQQAAVVQAELQQGAADPLSVLLRRQVIAAGDAHRLLG